MGSRISTMTTHVCVKLFHMQILLFFSKFHYGYERIFQWQ